MQATKFDKARNEPMLIDGGIFIGIPHRKVSRKAVSPERWREEQQAFTHMYLTSIGEVGRGIAEVSRRFYRKYGEKKWRVIATVWHDGLRPAPRNRYVLMFHLESRQV
jgi:hypothetical protein